MDFVDKNIEKYVEALSDKESPLLKEINEYTINHVHQPRMLSGHLQGRILSFISKIKHPKNILEIGTYTGYSALCLAEGLAYIHGCNNATMDVFQYYVSDLDVQARNGLTTMEHSCFFLQ